MCACLDGWIFRKLRQNESYVTTFPYIMDGTTLVFKDNGLSFDVSKKPEMVKVLTELAHKYKYWSYPIIHFKDAATYYLMSWFVQCEVNFNPYIKELSVTVYKIKYLFPFRDTYDLYWFKPEEEVDESNIHYLLK